MDVGTKQEGISLPGAVGWFGGAGTGDRAAGAHQDWEKHVKRPAGWSRPVPSRNHRWCSTALLGGRRLTEERGNQALSRDPCTVEYLPFPKTLGTSPHKGWSSLPKHGASLQTGELEWEGHRGQGRNRKRTGTTPRKTRLHQKGETFLNKLVY